MGLWSSFFKREAGFDSFLPYIGFVDEGILFLKNGGFCSSYEIRGRDLSSSTEDELSYISMLVNSALKKFGTGWMLHIDTIRQTVNDYPEEKENYFQDKVTKLIEASRRSVFEKEGNVFGNKHYLTVTYTPPAHLEKKMNFLFEAEKGDEKSKKEKESYIDADLKLYKENIENFIDLLSTSLFINKLTCEESLTYYHFCITGLKHKINLPIIPMYLDSILASHPLSGGFKPKIGDKHIRVLTIKSFPSYLHTGILDLINHLPFEMRFSTRFVHVDQASSKKYIEDRRKDWDQAKMPFMAILNEKMGSTSSTIFKSGDAVAMSFDADAAVQANQSQAVAFGFYTPAVVLMDEDEKALEDKTSEVLKLFEQLGFPCFVEKINAVEAYLGTLPGIGYANLRKPLISTHNMAHLMPLTAAWSGDARHPNDKYACKKTGALAPPLFYSASSGRTPFRVSLHVKDVGHTLIVGPTGAGKSTLLSFIAAQHFRYQDARVFFFDKGYSQFVLCNAAGGSHFDIASDEAKISFCPLANIDSPEEKAKAYEWIEMLVELQCGRQIQMEESKQISITLDLLAMQERRRLSDFVMTVQNFEVRNAVNFYADKFGHLFNGEKNFIAESKFCVFEIEHLMNLGEKVVLPALSYMFTQIEKRLIGAPTLLVLDEAWILFNHPKFAAKIREWLKVLRKANCAVIFATQSISDISESTLFSVLLESCLTKIYLPNYMVASNSNETIYNTYKSCGLNIKQINIIGNASSKREYYLSSENGNRLFEILFDKISLAFVGSSTKDDILQARKFMKQYGENWVLEWLKHKKISEDWINYYQNLHIASL